MTRALLEPPDIKAQMEVLRAKDSPVTAKRTWEEAAPAKISLTPAIMPRR